MSNESIARGHIVCFNDDRRRDHFVGTDQMVNHFVGITKMVDHFVGLTDMIKES